MSSQISSLGSEAVRVPVVERTGSGVDRTASRQVAKLNASAAGTTPGHPDAAPVMPTSATAANPASVNAKDQNANLEAAFENVREQVTDVRRELQFSVDESSGRTIITVIDSDSGKIIRQIPPEELLEMAEHFAAGDINLIDSRA